MHPPATETHLSQLERAATQGNLFAAVAALVGVLSWPKKEKEKEKEKAPAAKKSEH